ncbi:transposase [bacterium]|nr:transposase [bacterium]
MKKYKESHQHQSLLLPPNLDELIEEDHLVRVIDEFVSPLSPSVWDTAFKGGGAPSYHPQMMLKIILSAYSSKIFSSRLIAKAVRQDVTFMWLAGMQRPSFNTINCFHSDYFRNILEDIFTELLNFLHVQNYISFVRVYEYTDCSSCPNKTECTKAEGNRKIYYNPLLAYYKREAWDNLNSEFGVELRKRRSPEIETFFGDLKHNNNFRRFLLRGLGKVTHELGLLAISYNLRKVAKKRVKKAISKANFAFLTENVKDILEKLIFSADLQNLPYCTNFASCMDSF